MVQHEVPCVSRRGEVQSVKVTRSTGYPEHDRLMESRIKQWKHRPYRVQGEARPACTRYDDVPGDMLR